MSKDIAEKAARLADQIAEQTSTTEKPDSNIRLTVTETVTENPKQEDEMTNTTETKTTTDDIKQKADSFISRCWAEMKERGKKAKKGIRETVATAKTKVGSATNSATDFVVGVYASVIDFVVDTAKKFHDTKIHKAISKATIAVITAVGDAVMYVVNKVKGLYNRFVGLFKKAAPATATV